MTLLHYFFDLTSFYRLGQKYKNIFVHFLVQMKTLKSPFEINWPLVIAMHSFPNSLKAKPHSNPWCTGTSDAEVLGAKIEIRTA